MTYIGICDFGHTSLFSFLQGLINTSPINVYLDATAARHVGFDGKTAGQHPFAPSCF